jgi:hypothetical protein
VLQQLKKNNQTNVFEKVLSFFGDPEVLIRQNLNYNDQDKNEK